MNYLRPNRRKLCLALGIIMLMPYPGFDVFRFAWTDFYPDTELYPRSRIRVLDLHRLHGDAV